METIRDKLIHQGASIEFISGICTIRLNAAFPYQRETRELLANLKQQLIDKRFKLKNGIPLIQPLFRQIQTAFASNCRPDFRAFEDCPMG